MRCAERFLLLLLLSVSLDFAATAVPTPSGFHWDDEEEAVQWRRSARISPTSSPGGSANPAAIAVFPARPRPPVPDRGRQQRRAVPRARGDLWSGALASPSPGEDH